MEISDLPAEMLLQIHQWLPLPDLKEAVLVCRLWRKVGEDPSLWKWCIVTVYKKDDIANLPIRRIKNIQEIKINPQNWDAEDWEAFFLATMELLSLKFIDGLVYRGLGARGTVEKGVFARALAKLEVVELQGTPYDQIEQLFTEMSRSPKFKKLQLENHDLSPMNPDLFTMVLSRLEDVRLIDNNATKEQMRKLFIQISDQNYLKKIVLGEGSVTHLEPGLFARALARVEEVYLFHEDDDDDEKSDDEGDGDDRTKRQIEAIFTELAHGTQLKKLEFNFFDLSEVASRKFARALSRLETVGLDNCDVTNDQLKELFTQMSDNTRTKKLSLINVNLSLVEPGLLAGVLVKMDDVALYGSLFNPLHLQMEAFFTEASHSTHLKKLDIDYVDLSSVEPEVFAQAVNRLEEVTLERNSLTDDQSQSLFTQMALSTKLKELDIDMSNISAVCPQTLAIALNKLDTVKLSNRTHLTRDQAEAFFIELARETSLKKLTMINIDLSALDPEILGTALAKLKEATLGGTRLAQEKIEVVLTHVLEEDCKLRTLTVKRSKFGTSALEDGPLDGLNPETVRKVRDKLKGELSLR